MTAASQPDLIREERGEYHLTPEQQAEKETFRARQRGEELLEAHQRVRRASKARRSSRGSYGNVHYRVEPQLPPDVLGIYVYLPKV